MESHGDLVREHFMSRLTYDRDKFEAAAAAFWTGGAFLHVPPDVMVERPFQIVYAIDRPAAPSTPTRWSSAARGSDFRLREYDLGGRLRRPGAARRAVRAVPRATAHAAGWRTCRTGAPSRREVLRRLHPLRARGARRPLHVDPDPPRRAPHPPAPRAVDRRARRRHAPPRDLLHRGLRAPRPVHGRPARGRPHDRRHRVEGGGHRRQPRVVRGADQDRARRTGVPHLPADPLDDALPAGQGRRDPVADRRDRPRLGLARRDGGRGRRGAGLLHALARAHRARRRCG